eukprot:g4373.t1
MATIASKLEYDVDDPKNSFQDITVILQDDGPNPVVPISYSREYVELMNIFRGLVKIKEYSKRALRLTEDIIQFNAANYSVWHFRRLCLVTAGNADLSKELEWVTKIAGSNPKNYQIWFHRRSLLLQFGTDNIENGKKELEYTESVFEDDAKNYHAWGHRQWVLKAYNLFENELDFIDSLLFSDIRNNSAWNQRWYVLVRGGEGSGRDSAVISDDVVKKEIQYCFSKFDIVKNNQAGWAYLEGLMDSRKYSNYPEIENYIRENVLSSTDNKLICVPAMSVLVDILEEKNDDDARLECNKILDQLGNLDVIRKKYWEYRRNEVNNQKA